MCSVHLLDWLYSLINSFGWTCHTLVTHFSHEPLVQTDHLIRVCSGSSGAKLEELFFLWGFFFFKRPFLRSATSLCAAPCSLLMNLSAEVFLAMAVMQVAPVM